MCCPLSTAMAAHADSSSFKFHYSFDYLTVIASVLLLKHLLQMAVRKSSALEEEVLHYAPRTLRRLLPTASFYHLYPKKERKKVRIRDLSPLRNPVQDSSGTRSGWLRLPHWCWGLKHSHSWLTVFAWCKGGDHIIINIFADVNIHQDAI